MNPHHARCLLTLQVAPLLASAGGVVTIESIPEQFKRTFDAALHYELCRAEEYTARPHLPLPDAPIRIAYEDRFPFDAPPSQVRLPAYPEMVRRRRVTKGAFGKCKR